MRERSNGGAENIPLLLIDDAEILMPRPRLFKPERLTDPRFSDLPLGAMLFYVALECHASDGNSNKDNGPITDGGYVPMEPRQLKKMCFPDRDDVDVEGWLDLLIGSGLLSLHKHAPSGSLFCRCKGWGDSGGPFYQRIDREVIRLSVDQSELVEVAVPTERGRFDAAIEQGSKLGKETRIECQRCGRAGKVKWSGDMPYFSGMIPVVSSGKVQLLCKMCGTSTEQLSLIGIAAAQQQQCAKAVQPHCDGTADKTSHCGRNAAALPEAKGEGEGEGEEKEGSTSPTDGRLEAGPDDPSKPGVGPKQASLVDRATQVFDYWRNEMSKSASTKFLPSSKRHKAVVARLKEGFTVKQICMAVDGCKSIPHNMGQNDRGTRYNDLELICRNVENLERFIEKSECGDTGVSGNGKSSHDVRKTWEAVAGFAVGQIESGDIFGDGVISGFVHSDRLRTLLKSFGDTPGQVRGALTHDRWEWTVKERSKVLAEKEISGVQTS